MGLYNVYSLPLSPLRTDVFPESGTGSTVSHKVVQTGLTYGIINGTGLNKKFSVFRIPVLLLLSRPHSVASCSSIPVLSMLSSLHSVISWSSFPMLSMLPSLHSVISWSSISVLLMLSSHHNVDSWSSIPVLLVI